MPVVLMLVMGSALLVMYLILNRNSERDVRLLPPSVTYMGTHKVTVKPGSNNQRFYQDGTGTNKTHRFTCAEVSVIIKPNQELWVNGNLYGELRPSSEIFIEGGQVTTNGTPASVVSREVKYVPYNPANEETHTLLAGHEVIIRPGSTMKTRVGGLTRHTLKVGDVTLTIDEGRLIVNNVRHGFVQDGDRILIDHLKVFVNDERREPK